MTKRGRLRRGAGDRRHAAKHTNLPPIATTEQAGEGRKRKIKAAFLQILFVKNFFSKQTQLPFLTHYTLQIKKNQTYDGGLLPRDKKNFAPNFRREVFLSLPLCGKCAVTETQAHTVIVNIQTVAFKNVVCRVDNLSASKIK